MIRPESMPSAQITSYNPTLPGDLATIIDRDRISLFSAEGTRSTAEAPFPRKEMLCLVFPFSVLPNAVAPEMGFYSRTDQAAERQSLRRGLGPNVGVRGVSGRTMRTHPVSKR